MIPFKPPLGNGTNPTTPTTPDAAAGGMDMGTMLLFQSIIGAGTMLGTAAVNPNAVQSGQPQQAVPQINPSQIYAQLLNFEIGNAMNQYVEGRNNQQNETAKPEVEQSDNQNPT